MLTPIASLHTGVTPGIPSSEPIRKATWPEDNHGSKRGRDARSALVQPSETPGDTDVLPKPPWRVRKEAYLEHLLTAPPSVLRVSLADKLNNLRAIVRDYGECGEDVWARFDPDADPAWYYGSLLHIFEERLPVPMTKELRETYNRLLEMTGTPEPARQGHGSVDSAP